MDSLTLSPISAVNGTVNLPGSKSLSNRALLLAALAQGQTVINNLLDSDDIRHMLNALKSLNVSYQLSDDKTQCTVQGNGGPLNIDGSVELFLGNAGTAMRPLCAALCLGQGQFTLTGEARMSERPIDSLVEALHDMGCDISYHDFEGFPPVTIKGTGIKGGKVKIDGSVSSQFLTAFLMAAPMAKGDIEIEIVGELVSKPYIEITLDLMKKFGVEVTHQNLQSFSIKGGQTYQSPGDVFVEGDASSASYFLAAAAIKGGSVTVTGVGSDSVQGDKHFADVLEEMGAKVTWQANSITVSRDKLTAVDLDMNHIPDAAMTIATTALFATGTTTIRNVYNWRVTETDRLAAMATELRKVGATVIEGHDYISITPPTTLKHAQIDTYNDHRIAMCFSLVALSDTAVTINDPGCTAKTFPTFFESLKSIC
ncbi:MAG: 3-phosphoshikimate 1-carboxyvinyltransferase [Psychrobium sp.]|nr:3-phosphoshikimate 1-carboxyvinyltransferase [Psychrobium sp.]